MPSCQNRLNAFHMRFITLMLPNQNWVTIDAHPMFNGSVTSLKHLLHFSMFFFSVSIRCATTSNQIYGDDDVTVYSIWRTFFWFTVEKSQEEWNECKCGKYVNWTASSFHWWLNVERAVFLVIWVKMDWLFSYKLPGL